MKKNIKTKFKNWLFVFLWMGVIFFFSHQPGLASSFPKAIDFVLRKMAHITEYAILTYLLIRALADYKISLRKNIILSVIIAILYAISDEYHQTFIFAREGAVRDVLIDGFGVLVSAWWNFRKMIK